jgi:hypothetical protein
MTKRRSEREGHRSDRSAPARIAGILRFKGAAAALLMLLVLSSCAKKEEFPNQIDDVKVSLGVFQQAITERHRALLDSVSTDAQLYDDLTHVLGNDSLAVLSRRIQNPIDSAHVIMTVGPKRPNDSVTVTYHLELFLRKSGDRYWIVAHRLNRSPQ